MHGFKRCVLDSTVLWSGFHGFICVAWMDGRLDGMELLHVHTQGVV